MQSPMVTVFSLDRKRPSDYSLDLALPTGVNSGGGVMGPQPKRLALHLLLLAGAIFLFETNTSLKDSCFELLKVFVTLR